MPPGRYTLWLRHADTGHQERRTVEVQAGKAAKFRLLTAKFPLFGNKPRRSPSAGNALFVTATSPEQQVAGWVYRSTAAGYDEAGFPYTQEQSAGGYIAMGLLLLWGLRRAFARKLQIVVGLLA